MASRMNLWGENSRQQAMVKKLVAWATIFTFLAQPTLAVAQAVADPNAPAQNKPKIENAQNGVPVVQIAAPSAAGVSRNLYQTLSVDPQGLILNNSKVLTQTQLAGYILGNANLAGGSARIILNEVTGTSASQLRGFIEVAGQRAEVIIANPNGIVVNGGGFINTSRAVLTTGTPIFGGSGSLEAFRIPAGQIVVEGTGLDARSADRVDLLSRAVKINAGIWAKELNVVTGANQVNNADLAAQKITGTDTAPAVALDVAALGGMYANKIKLVGTEAGVGVNSQGTISAAAGDLTLTQEGKIVLAGATSATDNITANTASDFVSQGTLYAGGNANITSTGTLTNTGVIAAAQSATVAAQSIFSTGTLGAGVKGDGSIGTSGDLTVTANGGGVNNTGGRMLAGGAAIITAAGTLTNDKDAAGNAGQIVAASVAVNAQDISNQGGVIGSTGTGTMSVTAANSLNNTGGQLLSNGKLAISAKQITNPGNDMAASGDLTLTSTTDFTNQGSLSAGGTLSISAPNLINATTGTMTADKTTLSATGDITNAGSIEGNQVTTTSQNLTNSGTILGDTVTLNAVNLTNQGATAQIAATGTVNLWVTNSLTNKDNARITSLGDINIAANDQKDASGMLVNRTQLVNNDSATIETGRDLNLAAEQMTNQAGQVQIGTTTTTSTKTLYQKPALSWYEYVDIYNYDEGGWTYVRTDFKQVSDYYYWYYTYLLGGPSAWWKLSVTVPKSSVISYDAATKKIVFYDGSIGGYSVSGGDRSYIYGPISYSGKASGQQTAYCTAFSVNSNGDYYIEYYPGYDPLTHVNPATARATSTDVSSAAREVRDIIDTTVTTEYISGQPTLGKVNVGRNLNLNIGQQFLNKYSSVAVGNAVTGNIGTLENQGYRLAQTSSSTVMVDYYAPYGAGGTWGRSYDYYSSTTYLDGGLTATFIAKTISVTGTNVSNIQARPDGTPGPQIGSTLTAPTTPGTNPANNTGSTLTAPQSGLYTVHPEAGAKYLVETNPRFANYQTFMSSDYMINLLGLDTTTMQKRVGDAYYEQKLIREQMAQLYGKEFFAGDANGNAAYKKLMDNAVAAATTMNLAIGVALTEAQIAALQSDIVWLVEQDVLLPDGQTQKALVPVVYLCQASKMKLEAGGALISADNISMNLSGNLENSGQITGTASTSIQADNIINRNAGLISSSGSLSLNANTDILNLSGTIKGKVVAVYAGRDIKNETTTSTVTASGDNGGNGDSWTVTNTLVGKKAGIEATDGLTIAAGHDISVKGATVTTGGNATVDAGRNIDVGTVEANYLAQMTGGYFKNERSGVTNVASTITAGGNLTLTSKGDTNISGTQVRAGGELTVAAEGNVTVSAVKDNFSNKQEGSQEGEFHIRNYYDETVKGSSLSAGGNVSVAAKKAGGTGGSVTVTGSSIASDTGKVSVAADKGVTVQETTERHETYARDMVTSTGFLSSTTTDKIDSTAVSLVKGSSISGNTVDVNAGTDLTVKGSSVVGTGDVKLTAGGNVNITTAQETSQESHYYYEKTSGIFSGGGLGITIGSKSEKSTLDGQAVSQVGSTIGSVTGNLDISAGKDVKVTGSDVISGKDTNIRGQNVAIEAAANSSETKQTYEFKQSGLTISLGGGAVTNLTNLAFDVRRIGNVSDERLKTLYAYKAYNELKELGKLNGDFTKDISINVSFGSTSYSTETVTKATSGRGSSVTAGADVNITASGSGATDAAGKAADGNVNIAGSTVSGQNVNLTAAKDINLVAADNTATSTTNTSSSSAGIGVSFGAKSGVFVTGSKGSLDANENGTTYTQTVVTASDTLTTKSGSDTNIVGAQAKGNTVNMTVGGNLNVASLQDTENYTERSSSSGVSIGTGKIASTASISKGKTDSTYASVTEQSGIYAGQGGFNINVGGNTDLKGAVIASDATPDKNKLSTGTLTYSDIQNKAEYKASSTGVNYASGQGTEKKDQGLTPAISTSTSGNADSITKSAISPGTIEVRSNPTVDLSGLSRDPSGALNALGKIFDKKTVAEQQELAKVFGEVAFKAIGDLGLKEGSPEKIAIDTVVGGIMSKLGGGSFASGAASAGFTQLVMNELANITDPAALQWASALIGAVAAKLVGGDAQTGASVAASQTKNNYLTHVQYAQYIKELSDNQDALKRGDIDQATAQAREKEITEKWANIAQSQEAQLSSLGQDESNISQILNIINKNGYVYDTKLEFSGTGREQALEGIHSLLKAGSAIPGFGVAATAGEIILYVAEGNNEEAVKELLFYVGSLGLNKTVSVVKTAVSTGSGASSRRLAENLIAAGAERPGYECAAHHIIAGNSAKANEARDMLQKYGIDIDDAANGVFLPTVKDVSNSVYHPSLHTNEYYNKVTDLLRMANSKEDALSILKDISDQLKKGTFMN